MTTHIAEPVFILLRMHKGPLPPNAVMQLVSIGILTLIYILFKEEVFGRILKWVVSSLLFIVGIGGQFIATNYGDRLVLWSIASAFISCIMFDVLKRYIINNRSVYIPPEERVDGDLTDQEKFEIHKISLVVLVLWFIVGFFLTRKF